MIHSSFKIEENLPIKTAEIRFSPTQKEILKSSSPAVKLEETKSFEKWKIEFPMPASEAVERLKDYLYPTEPNELKHYEFVYYLNLFDWKACNDPPKGNFNDGYDNENGEYLWRKGDHVSFRFEIKRQLGKGSFGIVFLCFDHKEKIDVALKIVRNKQKLKKQG